MTQAVPDVLSRIIEQKRAEIPSIEAARARLEEEADLRAQDRRDFRAALLGVRPAIIAEAKKASPSKGVLAANFDAARIATRYRDGGAACLSVLTDSRFFQGSLADLSAAREASGLPVLRKDFTIAPVQVIEAAAGGADAILLIAAILPTSAMRSLRELAARYRMAALVEVHDAEELARAADSGAEIIGVNNRNLHDFTVSLDTAEKLAPRMPRSSVRVAESGIHSPDDIRRLMSCGYAAFLVGEHLMKSDDPAEALRRLRLEAA